MIVEAGYDSVFPALAGINRLQPWVASLRKGVPRASGDKPVSGNRHPASAGVFPALAGINRPSIVISCA